jgi:predicted peptidase
MLSNAQTQTGEYTVTSNTNEILGEEISSSYTSVIDADEEITWEIYVPKNYDPNDPPGVMVYISPQNQIKTPSGWMTVMEESNLIWIAARKSGNKVQTSRRILFAVMSLPLIQQKYQLNVNRIYISGLSGGGRVASIVATEYAHMFKGAIYNCGVNFWNNKNLDQIELIKKNRFVFVTGTADFNLQDTKDIYAKYKKAGVEKIKLMVISRMSHENPKRNKFSQAINFLDN